MGCESPRLWAMGKLERGWGQAGLWGGVQLRKGILLPSLLLLLSCSQHPGEGWECSVLGRAPWSRLRAHGLVLCVREGALAWIWLWTGFCCIPRDAAAPLFGFIYPSDFLGAFFCFSCFFFFFPFFLLFLFLFPFLAVNRGQISPTALPPSLSTELCCSQGANAARKEPELLVRGLQHWGPVASIGFWTLSMAELPVPYLECPELCSDGFSWWGS